MSYYEDELSKWYISGNNKHSTFLNQIKSFDLKDQVDSIIDMKKADSTFDTRFYFQVKGVDEQFSVWIDDDENKNKLYRLTPGANSSKPPTATSNTIENKPNTGGGFSNKPNSTGERGFFDSKSHRLVTEEEYIEKSAKDIYFRPLTTKEKTPNNFVFFIEGKKQVWLWCGTWIKPKSS